jgi:ribosomal protein L11 methyltransferase
VRGYLRPNTFGQQLLGAGARIMPAWIRFSVTVPTAATEPIEDLLLEFGAVSVTLQAADDEELFARHGADAPLWQQCRVEGLFDSPVDWQVLSDTVSELEASALVAAPVSLADTDWSEAFRQYAVDRVFNDRLRLAPRGSLLDENIKTVELDPGLAFGSGSHPTTRLCLEWISKQELDGLRTLDFGCGSGVLGISMALLGAAQVTCVDVDLQALQATRENADHNAVPARVLTTLPTAAFSIPAEGYDVVIANILLQPLIELAPILVAGVAVGGTIVLSGVLATQRLALIAAYPEIDFQNIVDDQGWLLLAGRRA